MSTVEQSGLVCGMVGTEMNDTENFLSIFHLDILVTRRGTSCHEYCSSIVYVVSFDRTYGSVLFQQDLWTYV